MNMNRNTMTQRLGILNLEQLIFWRVSGFLFNVVSSHLPTNLFSTMLSRAHHNDRSGKIVFFRESKSRASRSSIVTISHDVIQRLNFPWLFLTKENFKSKVTELVKTKQNPFKE